MRRTYIGTIPPLQPGQSIAFGTTAQHRIELLYKIAEKDTDREYYIPYTATETNLPGELTPQKLAYMFACREFIPTNILFEESFWQLVDDAQLSRAIENIKKDK